jgi:4-hydroxybenzoate polyprenyltransferase/phosphoserine phosphatase
MRKRPIDLSRRRRDRREVVNVDVHSAPASRARDSTPLVGSGGEDALSRMERSAMMRVEAELAPLAKAERLVPLCVDLDGTLVAGDTLVEGVASLVHGGGLLDAVAALCRGGRAAFKRRVAERGSIDCAILPYNEDLLGFLRQQKAAGRRLMLATAADRRIAEAIAAHLDLFDEVIASDGAHNLKGAAKAEALMQRFGRGGFDYAGNDRSDLAIWRSARAAILVNTSPAVARAARKVSEIALELPRRTRLLPAALKAARPHQWVKNLLVFVPILTAHALDELSAWFYAAFLFAAFCATASAIYIINDLVDLAADRRHPRKRLRPFASGALSLSAGLAMAAALLCAGVPLAALSHGLYIVAVYAMMSITYSFWLKRQPLVDVFLLAALYTVRMFGGGEATGHRLSLWLLAFSTFLFLGLALLKRVEELSSQAVRSSRPLGRRGYLSSDADILQTMGCGASFASSLVLALFVQSEATAERYASPGLLWAIVPLMLFWQCRLWLSTARGYMHDDPIVYAARDWVSWSIGIAVFIIIAVAKSVTLSLA